MALLDIIQYQSPETLKDEPSEVIGKLSNYIIFYHNFNYKLILFLRSFV